MSALFQRVLGPVTLGPFGVHGGRVALLKGDMEYLGKPNLGLTLGSDPESLHCFGWEVI